MKIDNPSLSARWITGGLLALFAMTSSAHAGHGVPAGVPEQQHIHLAGQLVVSPAWAIGVGLALILATAMLIQRRRSRVNKR